MKVLIDTNVLIDFLQQREGFADAEQILSRCAQDQIQGFVAAHSIPNMFFILRKFCSEEQRRNLLLFIVNLLQVVPIDSRKIEAALTNSKFKDFEDCLQDECAAEINADFIITRNIDDFANSKIKPILPGDFLKTPL